MPIELDASGLPGFRGDLHTEVPQGTKSSPDQITETATMSAVSVLLPAVCCYLSVCLSFHSCCLPSALSSCLMYHGISVCLSSSCLSVSRVFCLSAAVCWSAVCCLLSAAALLSVASDTVGREYLKLPQINIYL